MRRSEARSAQISRPKGVTRRFQISRYSIEPFKSVRAANLFANDDWRAALADEVSEIRPQVSFVSLSQAFASAAKRLAWATAGPDGSVNGPAGDLEGIGPAGNSGKEMALVESHQVSWPNVEDAARINSAFRDELFFDEFGEPGADFGIIFIVIIHPSQSSRHALLSGHQFG